jgi:hypothetical protein
MRSVVSLGSGAQAGRRGLLVVVAILVAILAWDAYRALVEPDSSGTPTISTPVQPAPQAGG